MHGKEDVRGQSFVQLTSFKIAPIENHCQKMKSNDNKIQEVSTSIANKNEECQRATEKKLQKCSLVLMQHKKLRM